MDLNRSTRSVNSATTTRISMPLARIKPRDFYNYIHDIVPFLPSIIVSQRPRSSFQFPIFKRVAKCDHYTEHSGVAFRNVCKIDVTHNTAVAFIRGYPIILPPFHYFHLYVPLICIIRFSRYLVSLQLTVFNSLACFLYSLIYINIHYVIL